MSGFLEMLARRGAGIAPGDGRVLLTPRPRARFEPVPEAATPATRLSDEPADFAPASETSDVSPARAPAPGAAHPGSPPEHTAAAAPRSERTIGVSRAPSAPLIQRRALDAPFSRAVSAASPALSSTVPPPALQGTAAPDGTGRTSMPSPGTPEPESNRYEVSVPVSGIGEPPPRGVLHTHERGERDTPTPPEHASNDGLHEGDAVSTATPPKREPTLTEPVSRTPAPSPPPTPPSARTHDAERSPGVTVSIGRIEVEIAPPSPPAAPARPAIERTRGFDAYALARRGRPR